MASVVFYMEDGNTLVHKLENEVTTIGRHPENLVVLTCPSSSGRHAVIKQAEDGVYVHDLNSSNGTRVNGAEIEEAKLKDGDRVGFGDVQAVFYAGDPPTVLEEKPVAPPKAAKAAPAPVAEEEDEAPAPAPKASKKPKTEPVADEDEEPTVKKEEKKPSAVPGKKDLASVVADWDDE
jgi:pSer/pThr/pTyr-binding forkhead associated (FHA) protein